MPSPVRSDPTATQETAEGDSMGGGTEKASHLHKQIRDEESNEECKQGIERATGGGDAEDRRSGDESKGSSGTRDAEAGEEKVGEDSRKSAEQVRGLKEGKRGKEKSGVVYVSRVPPGMDVGAMRGLLCRVGRVGRIWLRGESVEERRERRRLGSVRRGGEFKDGWVEFERRGDAKRAVELLNGRAMRGGKRRGRWGDDLWCLRYLKGFSWGDLVEESGIGGGRERVLRIREEVAAARRERGFVEDRVEMARRLEKKGRVGEGLRRFKQKRVIEDQAWQEVEDEDERKARVAMERVDRGEGGKVDTELAGLLFKKRRRE